MRHGDNQILFERVVAKLNANLRRNKRKTDKDVALMLEQIQKNRSLTWMEGPLGWTAWVENKNYVFG